MAKRRAEAACAMPMAGMTKREAILEAALQVFLDSGYAAANMDTVASRAGVSKATIYAYFSGKDALFGELIRARCKQCFGHLDQPDLDLAGGVRPLLAQMARNFWDLVTSPEALAAYRIVVAEAPRFPEVGRAFYEAGPGPGYDAITRFFTEMSRRGLLSVPDPRAAAEHFIGMLRSDAYLKLLLGLPDDHDIDAMIAGIAEVTYRAYAPQDAPIR